MRRTPGRIAAAAALTAAALALPASASARPVATVSAGDLALAGRLLIVSIPGTSVDATTKGLIQNRHLGGVVLFGYNITTAGKLKALDANLHKAAGDEGFLVTVDQEGGTVRRISAAEPKVSAQEQAKFGPAGIQKDMTTAGRQLKAFGVDVDLAPVADLGPGGFLGTRSYGSSPSKDVAAAITGLQHGGVIATAKHFPGLGGLATSTDDAPVSAGTVHGPQMAPFQAAVKAKVGLMMISLASYKGLGNGPAALQKATYQLLRGPKINYQGPCVTDALDAQAVAKTGEAQAAVKAIAAGTDLVMVPGGAAVDQQVIAAIQKAVRNGTISAQRYEQALAAAQKLELTARS